MTSTTAIQSTAMQKITDDYDDIGLTQFILQPLKSTSCLTSNSLELATDMITDLRQELLSTREKRIELAVMQLDTRLEKQRRVLESYKTPPSDTTKQEDEKDPEVKDSIL